MTTSLPGRRELDPSRLKRGGVLLGLGLIISSWVGIFIGTVLMAPIGAAPLGAVGGATVGWWAVPIFGFIFGSIGLARARNHFIRQTRTELVGPDHILTRAVTTLAAKVGLPPPQVGIYPDLALNAFAAGSSPEKAVVSFSRGLVDQFPPRELLAIAAHEVAHIANNDMRRMQMATSFQKALTWYLGWTDRGQAFACWVLGIVGEIMLKRLSRSREYWADATAAALVGKEPMVNALRRLGGDPVEPSAEHWSYARMMIRANGRTVFSTHPSIEERIEALETERFMRQLPYLDARGS